MLVDLVCLVDLVYFRRSSLFRQLATDAFGDTFSDTFSSSLEVSMAKLPNILPVTDLRQDAAAVLKLLARGEKEIAAGKGYDLDAVLAEADALLGAEEQ